MFTEPEIPTHLMTNSSCACQSCDVNPQKDVISVRLMEKKTKGPQLYKGAPIF